MLLQDLVVKNLTKIYESLAKERIEHLQEQISYMKISLDWAAMGGGIGTNLTTKKQEEMKKDMEEKEGELKETEEDLKQFERLQIQ